MAEYARLEGGAILERREIENIPPHKAHLWVPVIYEGSGTACDYSVQGDHVRGVRSDPPLPDPVPSQGVPSEMIEAMTLMAQELATVKAQLAAIAEETAQFAEPPPGTP